MLPVRVEFLKTGPTWITHFTKEITLETKIGTLIASFGTNSWSVYSRMKNGAPLQ